MTASVTTGTNADSSTKPVIVAVIHFLVSANCRSSEQHQVDPDRQHDLGRDRVPVDRGRHPVAGLGKERGEHQPNVSPRRATISVTAGSITLNISCGYTPNTTMAIRNGVQAIHSIGVTS